MAFESLTNKLQSVFKNMKNRGKLSEQDIKDAMREVKLALLEADVNFKVVRTFVKNVSEKAVGEEVMKSLTPGQQVIKIVKDEMVELLGGTQSKLTFSNRPPTVIMMVGLQGAGKTTTSGKLGGLLKKQGKRPLLVACDVYRAAAIKQLQVVGGELELPVFTIEGSTDPVAIAGEAMEHARRHGNDVVIIDTAGRLHINEELMDELARMKETTSPHEILLTVDAMTGQDAVNVAESFHEKLGIDGVVLTKFDGDTRGGAALSVRSVTGKPIKFIGTGEKLSDIEPFFPDRIASRILGMGDVLTLIDKAQEAFDDEQAAELEKKIRSQSFNFEDFLTQLRQMKKMGPLNQMLGMIPGVDASKLGDVQIDDKQMAHVEAIILSMTKDEREKPSIINFSRRQRIAAGSGRPIAEVNRLMKQFEQMKKMMKQMNSMTKAKHGKSKMRFPFR